ncbi:hypothetical protein ACLMJK_000084 [Lecanora helva]
MEAAASGLALAEGGLSLTKAVKQLIDNYRNADSNKLHAHNQAQQYQLNKVLLDQLSQATKDHLGPALASLDDFQVPLKTTAPLKRKIDRLIWALLENEKAEKKIAKSSQTEMSMILGLLAILNQEV